MNAVFTLGNNVLDLIDPYVACVARLKSAASSKAHIMNREYDCAEESQILVVKRAIDKDVLMKICWDFFDLRFRHVRMLAKSLAFCSLTNA